MTKYLVSWKGFGMDSCTWEPIENLETVLDEVQEFERILKEKKKPAPKTKKVPAPAPEKQPPKPKENSNSKPRLTGNSARKGKEASGKSSVDEAKEGIKEGVREMHPNRNVDKDEAANIGGYRS